MHTRSMLRSRKGISPILATLLLIVIAVAAIVVTYAWIMTYMGNAGQQAGVLLYKANVDFFTQNGTDKISIDIGNSGTSDTDIITVYCGLAGGSMSQQISTPPLPISVYPQQIARATISYEWTAEETYHFKIVSSSGQILDWNERAPIP